MNKERPDERDAKNVFEGVTGIELEHADHFGGVDYLSIDGEHAVEITRVTTGGRRAGRDALERSRRAEERGGDLQTCWLAFAPDTVRGLKSFMQRVRPAIVELELAGETFFERQRAAVHVIQRGPLSHVYRTLLDAGVERATAVPNHSHRSHIHEVIPTLGSGGSSSGSDEALDLLVEELSKAVDNPKKLEASEAPFRHLYVWLDNDTRFNISRPLSRDAPSWRDEEFGVPSRMPLLDPAITHLWVVHERSRQGWLWDGEAWRPLRDL